jgi:hypothetical protein
MRLAIIILLALGTLPLFAAEPEAGQNPGEAAIVDPSLITGIPPSLPLRPAALEDIVDDQDHPNLAAELELEPMSDVLVALKASSQEFLAENAKADVDYTQLMKSPEQHRGEVVRLEGVLAALNECKFAPNPSGLMAYWKGFIVGKPDGQVSTFISIERPGAEITKGSHVELCGYFFKRYCFLNREPSGKYSIAPLLFIRSARHIAETACNKFVFEPTVELMLPREEAVKSDRQIAAKFRLKVQLKRDSSSEWYALVENQRLSMIQGSSQKSLIQFLIKRIEEAQETEFPRGPYGEVGLFVNLRIPADAPMREAERLIMTIAQAKLVNVNYMTDQKLQPKTKETDAPPPIEPLASPVSDVVIGNLHVHVKRDGNNAVYSFQDTELSLREFTEKLTRTAAPNPRSCSMRTSYDPDTSWGDVMAVFHACSSAKVGECGLIPLRGDNSAPLRK